MFRKLIFGCVACAGVLSPLAVPSSASAREYREFHHEHRHAHAFRVYYRDPCRPGWIVAGTFLERHEAVRLAAHYRHLGFVVRIG
jgi:hypothetical protein